jgi:hypothetical protein
MPQILRISCSWCELLNDVGDALDQGKPIYCRVCQHRADVLREACDCRSCSESKRLMSIRARERERRQGEE